MGQIAWFCSAPRSKSGMLCSQFSGTLSLGCGFVSSRFIPKCEFDAIPESKFVVDDAKVVLDDVLGGPDAFCDFLILESLGDEFNDKLLSFTRNALSVTFASEHSCLRYKRVASFTRLIPVLIPKRKKRRLKCAFTVRRAIWSCLAISVLSHPCSSNSVICCSRGPRRNTFSLMPSSLPLIKFSRSASQYCEDRPSSGLCCRRPPSINGIALYRN